MKLPDDLMDTPYLGNADPRIMEAIVRHCAKVCVNRGPKTGALAMISASFAKEILAEFGLEEK